MSDMNGAEFTVRLVNQITGPARAIQKQMRDVTKATGDMKRALDAPAAKSSALSDWDKMVSKAKLSQIKDFSKSRAAAMKPPKVPTPEVPGAGSGGLTGMLAMAGPEGMAIAAVAAAVAAVTAGVFEAGKAVVSLGVNFVETALEAGRFAESSTKAIGYLTDNALHAGTVFDDVRHLAQSLGLEVNSTVEGFQKLLAAQFTVGQAKGLIKMGADMRAIGASAEEVQRIIYAMSEIKSIGTLQKRQERMLQMAGISGQLIDQALMKRTGIKTKGGLDLARKKGLIDADTAIAAVQDAVMMKTHEKALGDTAKKRGSGTLDGMLDRFSAGVSNFWTDVGDLMEPGAVRVAKLIEGTINKIMTNPQIAGLGTFLLAKWERFSNWVVARWPVIESTIIGGFQFIAGAITWVADALTLSDTKWRALEGVLILVAAAFAVSAVASFMLFLPLLLLVGVVGLAIAALSLLTTWVIDQAKKWYEGGRTMVQDLILGILSMMGPLGSAMSLVGAVALPFVQPKAADPNALVPIPGMQQPYTELRPDTPSSFSALAGTGGGKTEGGTPSTSNPVHIGELAVNVHAVPGDDPNQTGAKIGAAVRAELSKVLKTLA